jgi:hypothetical protein
MSDKNPTPSKESVRPANPDILQKSLKPAPPTNLKPPPAPPKVDPPKK